MSLITPDFGLLFWMTLIFGLLFFLLAKFGFPMITRMVDSRSERIEKSLRDAEEARRSLEELAARQEALIEQARIEQARILKETSAQRDAIIAKAREDASEEAGKILSHAKMEINAERENAIRDIQTQVSALAVEIAEKIVRRELDQPGAQVALADKLVEEASKVNLNS